MIKQFVVGSHVLCVGAPENDLRGLKNGREYIVLEANHVIDGEEYIIVRDSSFSNRVVSCKRVKAEYFA